MKLTKNEGGRARNLLNWCWIALCLSMAVAAARSQGVSTTTVQGTVYLANGQPCGGTLVVSWPAFTTAAGQAIASDRITLTIPSDGFVSVNLAPNQGATPAGEYYTAVYYMSDGSSSTEYWVVPSSAQATLAQVRAQVMPAAEAVQAVSKSYVDQSISQLAQSQLTVSGGNLSGPLYLNGDPTQTLQAADKHYVDTQVATALPLTGGTLSGPVTATKIGAAYQVDQFPGADFGARLQACANGLSSTYGGTCDARNFSGTQSMSANVTISTANTTVLLPCATISTASQIVVTAGTRNVALRGCALRGGSAASGSQGGTALAYSGAGAMIQVGDLSYATDTPGFHLDNVVINTTGSANASAQGLVAYRTQEMDLESVYFLGNANQTGITLDGTGNYTGGTFLDDQFSGFQTAVNAIGHQTANPATTDWMNASSFVRLHIDCPTVNGNPIAGTYGINLQQGDGNTFSGGDVEGCATALHLGPNAQNNTIVGLRNENSTRQVVADAGSSYNNWITGGTMFTGQLTDNGTRNSFLDTFHRSFNGLNGDWYGSQQDATLTNHYRLGIGSGNERGLLNRYQTDYGYRWTTGLSDGTSGEQFYQVLDELNNVYRLSIGQYNNGQSSTNNQTVINSAGTGAVVLNGSSNAGTGGVVIGSGGPSETTVASISNAGNAQFNGTLQVSGTSQSAGTMTVRNNADAEVDYYLWPGLTASQKGSFTYKDWNGNSQWYMVKDASNNWALNSAVGGIDSFKAYQSTNSGDTYVNASNAAGVVRVNYETGSGSAFKVYGGGSGTVDASFTGPTSIAFPGLAAGSGYNCLHIDSSGYVTNTGADCGAGGGATLTSGSAGQYAKLTSSTAMQGVSAATVLSDIGGASQSGLNAETARAETAENAAQAAANAALPANGCTSSSGGNLTCPGSIGTAKVAASVNSVINVMAPPYNAKGDCSTDDHAAITAALRAADTYAVGLSLPAVVYFPKPPGGCYKTSTLTWYGESLEGQPPSIGSAFGNGGVPIQGMPGEDILHVPDPTTTNFTFYDTWSIQNISFVVDSSAAGSFPHRWPGRWVDDGAMTAGSAVFKSPRSLIACGDIGQAIQVNGAGPGGSNLVTTIASVYPCWAANSAPSGSAWTTIALAAAASTTVSDAHTYISVADLPVTTTIGNCALAFDDVDGNTADWVHSGSVNNLYDSLSDVQVASVGAAVANNSCGIYTQGVWAPYGTDVRNFAIDRQVFGVVQGVAELNSYDQSGAGDFEKWDHGLFNDDTYPWISYDGDDENLTDIEMTATYGPQILQFASAWEAGASFWTIRIPELESNTGSTGFRIAGTDHNIESTVLVGGQDTSKAIFDTENTRCITCFFGFGTVYVNGDHNYVRPYSGGAWSPVTWIDGGRANVILGGQGATLNGMPLDQNYFVKPSKGDGNSGEYTSDFLQSGNATTPWTNNNDLLFWPQDVIVNPYGGAVPYQDYVVADAATQSGYAMYLPASQTYLQFSQFEPTNSNGYGMIGTQIPAVKSTFYFSARCTTAGTAQFYVYAGGASAASTTFSCTTSYTVHSFTVDLSSYSGVNFGFGSNGEGTPMYVAWAGLVPWDAVRNVNGPVNATSVQVSGDTVIPSTTTGFQGTSGTKVQLSDGTGSSGPAYFAPDGSVTATPSYAKTLANCGTLTLAAASTTSTLSCAWVTANSTCSYSPMSASAAGLLGGDYYSVGTGVFTLSHATAAGTEKYGIACSAD